MVECYAGDGTEIKRTAHVVLYKQLFILGPNGPCPTREERDKDIRLKTTQTTDLVSFPSVDLNILSKNTNFLKLNKRSIVRSSRKRLPWLVPPDDPRAL